MSEKTALESLMEDTHSEEHEVWAWVFDSFQQMYPNLYELMACKSVAGVKRDLSKLSIFTDEGVLKVGLFCPTEGRMAFLTLSDPRQVFGVLEKALATGTIDWRRQKRGR